MENIYWTHTLEMLGLIGGIATIIGIFLGPMIYLGAKIDAFKKEVRDESKDFHSRLLILEERYLKLREKE